MTNVQLALIIAAVERNRYGGTETQMFQQAFQYWRWLANPTEEPPE